MKLAPEAAPAAVTPVLDPVARIQEHATRQPDSTALVDRHGTLSYAGLTDHVHALAGRLREAGVRPGDVVAVHLERSAACVVAAAAVLAARAAYLLIDVHQPAVRQGDLLLRSGAKVVLGRGAETAEVLPDATLVDVGALQEPAEPAARVEPGLTDASDLAYVTYTSGSTGRPKAALIEHGGLANLLDWYADHHATTSADRFTHMVRPSFDAFALEVWPALTAGGELHIVEGALLSDPEKLRDWLCATGITVSFVPTPLAERLFALDWPTGCALRHLLTGGDRLTVHPPAGLPFRVHNNYGPTECSVVATCCEVVRSGPAHEAPPIGRPLPGVTVHVLDPSGAEVADGTAGELHIGGVGVGRGYLDAPARDAARFHGEPGERRYATGDLVLRDGQGLLHYLGRTDDQVQIGGYRIEPGEIEAVVLRHPSVAQASVVARDTQPPQLVAYVVPAAEKEADPHAVREFVAGQLPDYMVPAAVVPLDALPVTAHGKVDRAGLADRELPRKAPEAPPADERFAAMTDLWREVLDVPDPGPDDDFFDLGGDSLRVIKLVSTARRRGIALDSEDVYEYPVLRELVTELADRTEGNG